MKENVFLFSYIKRILFTIVVGLCIIGASSAAKADDYAYFMDFGYAGLLGKIDLTTGASSKIGFMDPVVNNSFVGLGEANGKLYAVSNSNNNFGQLWSIDTSTGLATSVGSNSGIFYSAIGSTTSGLYATGGGATDGLYSINPTTGAATLIGVTGVATDPNGQGYYAGAHDLSTGSASLYDAYGANSYHLYSISTATGTETSIGSYVSGTTFRTFGVAEVNGTLYGTGFANDLSSTIRTIDPVTGVSTVTATQYYSNGDTVHGISSLAPDMTSTPPPTTTPEPATMLLLGLGLMGLAGIRRKLRSN